jgi:acetylornithine deacetylase
LIARVGPEGTDGLTLSGHLDVVPTEGQPWTSDPFRLRAHGDHLYGRGTADMKGFLAATLGALARLGDLRALRRELVLIWTADEEIGCMGSAAVAAYLAATGRPAPCACLIGEPTDFAVMRMHPGHVHATLDCHGRAAHSSRPELGVNAIDAAAEAMEEVRELAHALQREARHDLPMDHPWVVLQVSRIRGGGAINIVPDACQVDLGYRPLPGMAAEAVFERLARQLAHRFGPPEAPRVPGRAVRARLGAVVPSLCTPADTELARALAPWARPGPEVAPFATDGGNLARAGMQPIVFGPGSIDVAHQADEFITRTALHRATDVIDAMIGLRCR